MSYQVYHVLPVNDLKEHEESENCNCGPETEYYENGMVIIHNSYDGREIVEEAERNAFTYTN